MYSILYKLVIASLLAECCSQSLYPENDGCTQVYDDMTDPNECIHTVYCTNLVRVMLARHDECSNFVHSNRHGSDFDPMNVYYRCNDNDVIVPRFDDYDYVVIYSLDLSTNMYASVPTIKSLPNLAILKITRSLLSKAKLSNENDLPKLTAIDYSENVISSFEVVPGEHEFKSLKKLNLSHNSLNNILDGTFELFPNIESLDLSHNYFVAIDIMFFEGIKKLLHLNMSNNRIAYIDSSLQRMRYLVTLDLSYNFIETVAAKDFAKLVNIQEIKLDSNKIHTIEKHVFDNTVSLTTVDLQDNAVVSIDQDIFINATKLRSIYLSRNNLKFLPKNAFKGKTIFDFTIEGNQLEGPLERGLFEGLGMVKELDLSGQRLTSIENYAFAGLQTLETLLLNNNYVELLRNYAFKGLQNLNCLDLSYNKINTLDNVTEDLISLQVLTLHHNKIAHISSNNFISLGSLQLLDLSHNNISYLGFNYYRSLQSLFNFKISDNPLCGTIVEKTFDGLSSLPSLDISGTLITTVNNGSFVGMTLLKELNISHSNITELQYNSLSYVGNIRTIDLSNNRLSVFDVNTTDLRNLDTLLLNNNMLHVISQTVFTGLSLLRIVDLSYNNIRTIHGETFQKDILNLDLSFNPELEFDVSLLKKTVNLAKLFISGTKPVSMLVTFENVKGLLITTLEMTHLNIQNISSLMLFNLQRLETLVLSNNAVSALNIGALSNLRSLKQLDLSYNNLNYIQPGTFKDNTYLKVLNISHNKLLEITHGIFQGLLNVEVIDLSFNKIKDLHRSRFYDVEHLDTLIVDNNEIEFISDDEFLGSSLSKLSIGGNPLPCKILYKFKRSSLHVRITAINIDETKDNLKGVTCNKDGYNFDSNVIPETVEHNKLLFDIRNILFNVSKGQIFKEPIEAKYVHNDSSYLESITNQQQKFNQHSLEIINSIKNLSSINNLTSIINSNTNILLGKILRVLTAKESMTTSKPIIVIKENATSGSLISYINKIKQDLEDTLAVERQNVLQLDDKINKINSKIDFSMTTKTPTHEKLFRTKDEDKQKSSVFTEVCVGLILVILICFILYKIYKSELYLPRGRSRTSTSSRRNIAESMESAQL
ncbi:transforming growth factor beta activator LRRC32-like [Cydia pomonella]|uniref:transforming growth factor beta activator LRRC32-like n=1 Tax=Cydia pomonella TaxID=82600 RepID=UPI002ADD7E31|nr:transforming growth factor beta activator LRRC32-like [Cydia pomonella]XP_061721112.1 transforming growth factor beta activator LRRC32-like [Cydia pomonella]